MIIENNIVLSQAKTAKEICAVANYNRSIELLFCYRKRK